MRHVFGADIDIYKLEQELSALYKTKDTINMRINELEEFNKLSRKYTESADEQVNRLRTIELFKQDSLFHSEKRCPLCGSELKISIPDVSEIIEAIGRLEEDLIFVKGKETINLEKEIIRLKHELEIINQEINKKTLLKKEHYKSKGAIPHISREDDERTGICYAINVYLEDIGPPSNKQAYLNAEKERLEREISLVKTKSKVDSDIDLNKSATFRWLSEPMKQWAEKLGLEDSGSSYYFDIDKLTVIADRNGMPLEMSKMRGHFNWAGCHIIVLLSLHNAFIERHGAIPSFIIFDQPPEESAEKTFALLRDVCAELAPNLQIIVTTHHQLDKNIIEPYWTEDNALVPNHWL